MMAEEVGFEPTEPCGSPVFKTGAIDHSATPPINELSYANQFETQRRHTVNATLFPAMGIFNSLNREFSP
jgi:hypothetical protein